MKYTAKTIVLSSLITTALMATVQMTEAEGRCIRVIGGQECAEVIYPEVCKNYGGWNGQWFSIGKAVEICLSKEAAVYLYIAA